MKKYFVSGCLVFLFGCASVTAPLFDPVEYNQYVSLYSTLKEHKANCENPETIKTVSVPMLKRQTTFLVTYAGHKQNNNDSKQMAAELSNFVTEMELRYTFKTEQPSVTYCQSKFDVMMVGAKRAMTAIGKESQK